MKLQRVSPSRLLSSIRKVALSLLLLVSITSGAGAFTTFESGQVRPLAQSPDGKYLFVTNTPAGTLEIYQIGNLGLTHRQSVPVGMEPVAVAVYDSQQLWVVNHLSDSVSIVDYASTPARVVQTLLVGDEPRDIVFAGTEGDRAFITTAHRGQNGPLATGPDPGEMTTEGVGRADVWVFDADQPGTSLGGDPLTIVTLFGDTPRALAVSPDGSTVYAAVFHSGNQTTTVSEGVVCDGGENAGSCNVSGASAPGGMPAPNENFEGIEAPETGLIVKFDGTHWVDELGREWDDMVRFDLPDLDVFAIDADAATPVEIDAWSGVGTILFNMAVHPVSGEVFVSSTEAFNHVRFEGSRAPGDNTSTVQGHIHETRVAIIDPATGTVTPRHLNKHIDYDIRPAPAGVKERSLGLPRQLAFSGNGEKLYIAAKGSGKIGVFSTAELLDDSFVPDSADHGVVTGGGPEGILLDRTKAWLYVTTRFDNGLSLINANTLNELRHYQLPNPEPPEVVAGRPFLYDTNLSSSNGEVSCGSCHVDGDFDSLAWDLGDPDGSVINNPGPFKININIGSRDFHPMKGPMTTQTLRGMQGHGAMHWRGDRTGGNDEANVQPDGGTFNEVLAFMKFIGAFVGLNGAAAEISGAQMASFTDFILQVTMPPNPIRNLDNSLNTAQQAGSDFFFNVVSDQVFTCNGCHVLDPDNGFFGTDGSNTFDAETQFFKVAHLRNMYTKVGMFGMPDTPTINSGNNAHTGDQIRGFGFLHDGSVDTMFRFFDTQVFQFNGGDAQRSDLEQFMLAFDSNLKPIVGQQVTQTVANKLATDPRVDLLLDRAAAGDSDVVVAGVIGGDMRSGKRIAGDFFQMDKASDAPIADAALRDIVVGENTALTFTAVPPGSGDLFGLDRDEDGVFNSDDVCPNIADPGQGDSDGDGVGDLCDNCPSNANADQSDIDGDGKGDVCDGPTGCF